MSFQKKLIVVGDGDCGKTCLLIAFTKDIFETEYVPTVFDTYVEQVQIGEKTVDLRLEDTAGQEDYDRLRSLQYTGTNVVLICFSVTRRVSFENIKLKWWPEIKHYCPNVPILLIGTKSDLRNDQSTLENLKTEKKPLVTTQEAENLAKKIGAVSYMECSAKTMLNVKEVFQEAAKASLIVYTKKEKCCFVM